VNTQLATIKLKTTQQGNDHLSVDDTKEIEFPFLTEAYNKIMQHEKQHEQRNQKLDCLSWFIQVSTLCKMCQTSPLHKISNPGAIMAYDFQV
jgi:hypothetical protein